MDSAGEMVSHLKESRACSMYSPERFSRHGGHDGSRGESLRCQTECVGLMQEPSFYPRGLWRLWRHSGDAPAAFPGPLQPLFARQQKVRSGTPRPSRPPLLKQASSTCLDRNDDKINTRYRWNEKHAYILGNVFLRVYMKASRSRRWCKTAGIKHSLILSGDSLICNS